MAKDNICIVGVLTSERVWDFKYLEVYLNEKNNMHYKIRMRINLISQRKEWSHPSYYLYVRVTNGDVRIIDMV